MKMQAAHRDTTRRARTIVALLATLALALLTAAPLAADTVTTGTSTWGWSGTGSTALTNACNGAEDAAEYEANCSAGTLTMSACSCTIENPQSGGANTSCSLNWTCTVQEDSDEEDGDV